ncbi:MAG TPA: hypothetical protein VJQ82_18060, partial [Terriglobales bacterium]|nr:hypothetical protein [Terriglobales bacterium]
FCIGPAISATLSSLEKRDKILSADAVGHFMDFCERQRIPILETPVATEDLSAQWLEETNYPEERLLMHARHSDITVLGRRHAADFMPENLIETLLKKSGRPVVIAPDAFPRGLIRTIVVAWNETTECARALGAAMPLLIQAHRVILLTVAEAPEPDARHLAHLARQLTWSGVVGEPKVVTDQSRSVADHLLEAARQSPISQRLASDNRKSGTQREVPVVKPSIANARPEVSFALACARMRTSLPSGSR